MKIDSILQAAKAADSANQIGKAIDLCQQALLIDIKCVDAYLLLGSITARQGQTAWAEKYLRRALDLDPQAYDAARWLTTLLIGRNGGGEAVAMGQRGVELRPNEAEAHAALGLAAMGAGDQTLAISSFELAVELNPNMAGAYHNLGVALQREESFEEATAAFERAAALAPDSFETQLHLARCYLASERGDQALASAEKGLSLKPESGIAKALHADARFMAVHGENGMTHIRAIVQIDPEGAFPQALLGSRLQEQGDFADAEVSIMRSIELQPSQGFAYYLLAHNRKFKEEDRPLVNRMESARRAGPLELEDRQYLHFALGKVYDDLGEYERAILHFDIAHEGPEPPPSITTPHANRVRRITELFSEQVLDQYSKHGLEKARPIFIFGMPRSGTTLLEQIVSRHSQVGAGGELFYWRDHCRRIVNLERGALNTKELERCGRQYVELLKSLAPGRAMVTDKFPSNFVYLGLLQLIFPNAVFIHARRNPLDTCLSIYMRPFSTNNGLGRTRREIVDGFELYRQAMNHWREVLGSGRLIEIDYEQMVQDPESKTRELIQGCGLPWEDACLNPQEGNRRVVTFSKWQVRQPVYTTSVARWKHYEPWLGIFRELVEPAEADPQ